MHIKNVSLIRRSTPEDAPDIFELYKKMATTYPDIVNILSDNTMNIGEDWSMQHAILWSRYEMKWFL